MQNHRQIRGKYFSGLVGAVYFLSLSRGSSPLTHSLQSQPFVAEGLCLGSLWRLLSSKVTFIVVSAIEVKSF